MRLLPPDSDIGYTPYLWLVYLPIFFARFFIEPFSALELALAIAAVPVFLALYFRGYWLKGRRVLWVVAALTALGAGFAPFNAGATVFFIYGASFLGQVGPPALGYRLLAAQVAFQVIETWLLDVRLGGAIAGIVISLIVGAVNIHYAEVGRRNARLLLAQREVERLAKLAERERIARDLHDLLGHSLSVITLKAELAAKLAERDVERAASEMREVETLSRRALSEVRRVVSGYSVHELGAELARARVALEAAGVELELETSPYDLTPGEESVMALALREAVTNVIRHAGAGRCRIRLEQGEGRFRLAVEDAGRGRRAPEGAGLAGMRERLALLDGSVELLCPPPGKRRGTRLVAELPLERGGRRAARSAAAGAGA